MKKVTTNKAIYEVLEAQRAALITDIECNEEENALFLDLIDTIDKQLYTLAKEDRQKQLVSKRNLIPSN